MTKLGSLLVRQQLNQRRRQWRVKRITVGPGGLVGFVAMAVHIQCFKTKIAKGNKQSK
jgi:hypothetical protein